MDSDSAIGLTLALCSVILTNISLLIQKYSAQVESGKPLYKRWRFIFGFILNTGSEIGLSAPASLFAPLSLLAPLGGVAVVVNALMTRFGCVCGIKERLSFLEWLATFLVMCGVALVAFSGPGGDTQVVLADLPAQFSQPAFLAFLIPAMVLVCFALFLSPPCRCAEIKLAVRLRPAQGTPTRSALSGFTAATCGAFSVLALKISLFTIIEFAAGRIAYPPPLSILCFLVLATCAPLQLYLLNLSLAAGKATFCIPLYLSLLMLFISFFGGVLFYEFGSLMRDPYPLYLCLYIAGCLLVLLGLAVLSYKQQVREGRAVVVPAPDDACEVSSKPSIQGKRRDSTISLSDTQLFESTRDGIACTSPVGDAARTDERIRRDNQKLMEQTNGYLCETSRTTAAAVAWAGPRVGNSPVTPRLSLRPLLASPSSSPMQGASGRPVQWSPHSVQVDSPFTLRFDAGHEPTGSGSQPRPSLVIVPLATVDQPRPSARGSKTVLLQSAPPRGTG
mmetsp:Transcript_22691/g.73440  ORF Transcript_22691/g.73440 Transcript_22691/m.73440 type:complete len:505 (+) Transcript_22691:111-1625(+)